MAFFSATHILEQMTPENLKSTTLTPKPIEMRQGTIIDHRISLMGIPLSWRTEICTWDPPHRFGDRQERGPYGLWEPEHLLEAG